MTTPPYSGFVLVTTNGGSSDPAPISDAAALALCQTQYGNQDGLRHFIGVALAPHQACASVAGSHMLEYRGERISPPCITPNVKLPPLDPTGPRRGIVIHIEVAADFENRLDNQWMVEREIHADRWNWKWADTSAKEVL